MRVSNFGARGAPELVIGKKVNESRKINYSAILMMYDFLRGT